MKRFFPQSPDPYMHGDQSNMTLARFGHLNEIVDQINNTFNSPIVTTQSAPAAKTTDSTLTASQILTGIITVNQGAAGTSSQQLPTGTAFQAAFDSIVTDAAFDFTVINTSTVAGEDAIITTNTGWTLVGSMVIESNDDDRASSSGRFRARLTGTNTWTLYRIS